MYSENCDVSPADRKDCQLKTPCVLPNKWTEPTGLSIVGHDEMLGQHSHLVLVTLHLDNTSRRIGVGGYDRVSLACNAKGALHLDTPVCVLEWSMTRYGLSGHPVFLALVDLAH